MIEVKVPGYKTVKLNYLVLDYNGTLSCDGEVSQGVKKRLSTLSEQLSVHVITADTFGKVESRLKDVPCEITVLPLENQDLAKLEYIKKLGADRTVCIGNGRNDRLMLKAAALGIAVVLEEGAAVETVMDADVVFTSINSALDLLSNPLRLTATLRS
jgi:soluble P-type ATPase